MQYFYIEKNTEFLIYGAKEKGKRLYDVLHKTHDVIGFLDKSGDQIAQGAPVYNPDSSSVLINKEAVVVVITISDMREHRYIKNFLSHLGYRRILFKISDRAELTEYQIKVNEAYENLWNGALELDLPFEESQEEELFSEDDSIIRKWSEDELLVNLPIELMFTGLNRKNWSHREQQFIEQEDMNIFLCYPGLDFFRQFEYSVSRNLDYELKRGTQKLLPYFYTEYRNLSMHLNDDHGYFIKHPIRAVWNGQNHFNILSRQIESIFLVTKNFSKIPTIITKQDYSAWSNGERVDECREYMRTHNISQTYTPILNGYFYDCPSYRENCGRTRLSLICDYIKRNKIEVKGSRVLDVGAYISYFGQQFYRMGAEVTTVEYNQESFELGQLLNKLLHCSEITALNCGAQDLDSKLTFDISILLTVANWHMDTQAGIDLLQVVSNATDNIMFWESGEEIEEEKRWILNNTSFQEYIKLSDTYGTAKLRELGVFLK